MAQVEVQLEQQESRFALRSKTFSIFMGGSLVTRVGDWMDLVVLNWAVLQFTNSPLQLAIINACRLVPTFIFSVPGGILADRYDRRKLLILLQSGMMLLTVWIGFLVEGGQSYKLFILIVTVRAILAAMEPPIRQALLPELVPTSSMASAIAINTTIIHLARIIGPAIAGVLLAVLNTANLFYLNALCMLGVILSLLMIRYQSFSEVNRKEKHPTSIADAIAFVKTTPTVQSLLILAVVPMLFGFPYTTMMPLFVKDLYKLGPGSFGMLLAISSIGALVGSCWLSIGRELNNIGKWLIYSIIAFGGSLLLFVVTSNIFIASIAMFLVGLTSQVYRTMSRITIQMKVPNRLRGRILSIALMDRGFIPLGALVIGMIATWAGTMWAGVVMGLGCIVSTIIVVTYRRQIYYL
ncbi:MFS transporter [Bacillus sp. SM2101]|uniref:MFS transporter n=1 Tax=Bacillus sp. SM2101 TaxID=2805366 RepID=UPI001BDEB3B9|nr:MFS transporter [Bacillus sp. SM2101]